MEFTPINNNVLCKRIGIDEVKTKSGIILDNKIKQGEELVKSEIVVIAENNEDLLKKGDIVYFVRNKADLTKWDGLDSDVEHYIVKESDILAIEE